MDVILDVTDLHIEFHDHDKPETVVEDFDLMLEKGEIVGIVGESGSGKSMSALAIAGLLKRHALTKRGRIMFDGHDLLTCDRKTLRSYQGDEISMIFQEPMTSLNPVKKIGWQVEESLRIHHKEMDKAERKRRAISMLEAVGLREPEKVYDMYPHELSGGMRQRAMIAAAMIIQPRLLIADEPTTALDVTIQAEIVELLKRINKERGTAILFISHDLSLVNSLCERVLVMQNGLVVESGNCEEIFRNPKQEYTKKLINAIPKNPFFKEA
jgi:peptide/nickel transport system ATP-binding protein